MSVHDAILEQALLRVEIEWLQGKLNQLQKTGRIFFQRIINYKLKSLNALPDLSWYVTNRSLKDSKKLLFEFFDDLIARAKSF